MFKLNLIYKSDGEYEEHDSLHETLEDASEEADDIAFNHTGFGLEAWDHAASFGEGTGIYYFYPVEGNPRIKYVLKLFETAVTEEE